ncbi:hypothetical protein AB0A66_26415 [Streptomyces longwoodensis]|uniref:hypothetical protein n=1 Tax=Streptomyces longwoodensis TaxID=68231 RepID=UPI0033E4CE46
MTTSTSTWGRAATWPTTTDTEGKTITFGYGDWDRTSKITTAEGRVTVFSHERPARLVGEVDGRCGHGLQPRGRGHAQLHDGRGRSYDDANIGPFTQPDPSGQEKNPYLYAEGDPVTSTLNQTLK